MNKKKNLAAIVLVASLGLAGCASATNKAEEKLRYTPQRMYEQMDTILERGNLGDLEKFRQKLGYNVMPWVQDEKSFKTAGEMHEFMEEQFDNRSYGRRGFGHMWNRNFIPYGCGSRYYR